MRGLGHYEVDVRKAGTYEVTLRFPALDAAGTAEVECSGVVRKAAVPAGASEVVLEAVPLRAGPGRMEGRLQTSGRTIGAHYVLVRG